MCCALLVRLCVVSDRTVVRIPRCVVHVDIELGQYLVAGRAREKSVALALPAHLKMFGESTPFYLVDNVIFPPSNTRLLSVGAGPQEKAAHMLHRNASTSVRADVGQVRA